MTATPYKSTGWSDDEAVYTDKLAQMANNDQWLYENTPQMNFTTYGIKKTSGLKIMAGIAILPVTSTAYSHTTYNFGTFFTSGCTPVIAYGLQRAGSHFAFHVAMKGIDGWTPDHRGFYLDGWCPIAGNTFFAPLYVHFIAVGW